MQWQKLRALLVVVMKTYSFDDRAMGSKIGCRGIMNGCNCNQKKDILVLKQE